MMHCLSDFRLSLNLHEAEVLQMPVNGLGEILWSVCRIFNFSKLMAIQSRSFSITNFYCHAALDISQIIKSQTELQIIALNALVDREKTYLKHSRSFTMLNYSFQSSLHLKAKFQLRSSTVLVSFQHSTLRIAALPFLYFWPSLSVKTKIIICLPKGTTSTNSPSI